MITTGKHILALLKQQGIKVSTVAKKMGYTREHLSRLLNGGDVDELLIWKLSNAVGVDFAALLDTSQKMDDDCESRAARLEAELEEARQTIRDLSRALGSIAKKN